MEPHHYYGVMFGGLLVGIAAGMVLLANGLLAGVSGMVSSTLRPRSADAVWQALFLVGLVAGGTVLSWLDPAALPLGQVAPIQLIVGAGLLVGFGRQALPTRCCACCLRSPFSRRSQPVAWGPRSRSKTEVIHENSRSRSDQSEAFLDFSGA